MARDDALPRETMMFFGWKVVVTAFIVAVFAWGVGFYGPSVVLNALHQSHGWSVSTISLAITTHFLLSALIVAHLAEMHRKLGVASVTRAGIAASAIGVVGWALATHPWHLFVAALLTGAGWALTSGAAVNAMVSPWFDRRRAIALSHAFNGSSLGGVLFTPLWVVLIQRLDFLGAAVTVGVVMLAVLWPLAGRFLSPTPQGMSLRPDGGAATVAPRVVPTDQPIGRAALLRDRRFVTLSGVFALGLFAQIGLVAHLVTRLAPVFGTANAAGAVSLATASAVAGRLIMGTFVGTTDRRLVAMGNFLMQASGVTCVAIGTSSPVLLLGCVLFGLGIGNLVSLPPLIAQQEFASTDVPRVVALLTAINQAVFAFAPAFLGWLRALSDSYAMPFLVAAAIQLIAAAVVVLGRPVTSPARTDCAARRDR